MYVIVGAHRRLFSTGCRYTTPRQLHQVGTRLVLVELAADLLPKGDHTRVLFYGGV